MKVISVQEIQQTEQQDLLAKEFAEIVSQIELTNRQIDEAKI